MNKDDKEITSRINLFYKEIFDKYENLTQENIDNLRLSIDTIFIKLRPTLYRNEKYRNQLYHYLYPNISLVGLCNLYSTDKYTQYLLTEIWIRPTITYGLVASFVSETENKNS